MTAPFIIKMQNLVLRAYLIYVMHGCVHYFWNFAYVFDMLTGYACRFTDCIARLFFLTYCSYVTDEALTVRYFWSDTVYFLLLALEDHEQSKIAPKFENL